MHCCGVVIFYYNYCIYLLFTLSAGIETRQDNCETSDIRLIGGTASNEGRLEICINNHWGSVCSLNWDNKDTQVACRQLGYQEQGMIIVCQREREYK